MTGGSVAGVCGCSGGGGRPVSRGPGLCALVGLCWPLGRDSEGSDTGPGARFACGVLVLMSACSGVHVWSRVGLEVLRRSLPSVWAAARISQMRARI